MIRTAIAGIGWWGKTLVEAVQGQSERIRFVAAATRTLKPEHRSFADRHGLVLQNSYSALLADPGVDAVLLATPPSLHHDQIVAAAAAGKHVFVEKPFAVTKAEAIDCVAAAQRAGITLGLGYNRRFHPAWQDLRQRVRADELGTVSHLAATMTSANGLAMPANAWRANRDTAPCGGLFPMAVHAIDAMIDLCGPFVEVYARSYRSVVANDVDDTTTAILQTASGVTATITTLMGTAPTSRFEVFGSAGRAELLGATHSAGQSSKERRMSVFGSYVIDTVNGDRRHIDVPQFDSVAAELEAFAIACADGPPFPIPTDDMIAGCAAAEAIVKSAASGRPQAT
jgi:predicted dehydrogenase